MLLLMLALAWCLMLFPFCVLIGRSIAAAQATLAAAEDAHRQATGTVSPDRAKALA
jgi:hypothetical protein